MPTIGQRACQPLSIMPFWQTSDNTTVRLYSGDLYNVLPTLPPDSFDSVVTDPPYELDFMGKKWDLTGVAFQPETWRKVLRVLKPGGYMVAFGGTRTYHRMTCAVEDAGFEIRDCLMWVYGTGFPKGQGCLKPAWEPIILARKPGKKVLPLGIDGCRIECELRPDMPGGLARKSSPVNGTFNGVDRNSGGMTNKGRYPANVLHDGSDEVMEEFEKYGESRSQSSYRGNGIGKGYHGSDKEFDTVRGHNDSGSASRFFYCTKASKDERGESKEHPTVKPLELMRWLIRLVTPEEGILLDCFAGSSMTGVAAMSEKRRCVLVEKELPYVEAGKRKLEKVEALLLPKKPINMLEKYRKKDT